MATTTVPVRDERLRRTPLAKRLMARPELGAVGGAIIVFIFFAAVAGGSGMFSPLGIVTFLDVSAQLGIIAVAAALLMIGGEFDLSLGSMIGFAGIVLAIPAAQWGWPIWLCIVAAFRASGNMLIAMVIALVSQWMLQFPLAYVLSKHTVLAAHGLWWSFPITNVASAVVSLCWFARGSWKETRLTEEDQQATKITDEAIIEEGIR